MQPIIIDVEAVAIADVDTYLEPVSAPANYKDEIKIAEYRREKRAELVERAALDVDLAQIICIGAKFPDAHRLHDGGRPLVLTVGAGWSETSMLEALWVEWNRLDYADRQFVTYNGLGYDLPLLMRRSLYLGVKHPPVQVDRFKHPHVIDLQALLSMDGKLKWRGLQFYLNRFGYTGGGPDITGAEIAERYAAGDWAAIEQHCRMDVEATAWLAERIGAVPKRQQAARAVGAF